MMERSRYAGQIWKALLSRKLPYRKGGHVRNSIPSSSLMQAEWVRAVS